jgi:hypothetical protein
MSDQAKAVMWIGLILIALNLVMRWKDISAVIFTGAGKPVSDSTQGGSKQPSITIPIDPFIPGPTIPKITIPLPKL